MNFRPGVYVAYVAVYMTLTPLAPIYFSLVAEARAEEETNESKVILDEENSPLHNVCKSATFLRSSFPHQNLKFKPENSL